MYDKIFECADRHPDAFVIMGGDFDACMSENDSLNRLSTRQSLGWLNTFKKITHHITSWTLTDQLRAMVAIHGTDNNATQD